MLNKNYIVFKEKGSSFGQIINIKAGRRYVLVRIPKKYLTSNAFNYIDNVFLFSNFAMVPWNILQTLELYVSNGDMVNLAQYLKQTYLSFKEEIGWIYVK